MFIRSDTITADDVRASLAHARSEGYDILVDEDGIREFTPRNFAHGFELFCEALSGPRARNGRPGKAASWDAYGVAMAYLFKLDPNAEIAWYKGVKKFIEATEQQMLHAGNSHRGYEAPWLSDAELRSAA